MINNIMHFARRVALLTALAVTVMAVPAAAQSKINGAGRLMLSSWRSAQTASSRAGVNPVNVNAPQRVMAFVTLRSEADASALELAPDVRLIRRRGDVAIVEMPMSSVETLVSSPAVRSLSFGNKAHQLMDTARRASYANRLILGKNNGFDVNYTGQGVLVGMMDSGIDPNHVNFMDRRTGANRVEKLWVYGEPASGSDDPTVTTYSTPAEIAAFRTENAQSTHATHVAGIMTGSYNKGGRVGRLDNKGNLIITHDNVPYYGLAIDSRIAVGCGNLTDVAIALAADNFADYATTTGLPAVFNISLGSSAGPHDGTDAICRYLDEVAKDVVVCMAAGNDGDSPVSLTHEFSASAPQLRTFLSGGSTISSIVDTWSSDSREFTMQFILFNTATGKTAFSYTFPGDGEAYVTTSNYNDVGYVHDPAFDQTFDNSYVYCSSGLRTDNNRYEIFLQFDLTRASGATLHPGIIISGANGTKINSWLFNTDGASTAFASLNQAGWSNGNPDQSINDMACGSNTICVGSYVTRNIWPTLSGYFYGYQEASRTPVNQVATTSSFGTLPSGRSLPDFCAPGQGIVASYSKYFIETTKADTTTMSASAVSLVGSTMRKNYWHVDQGTSMATPYVSGVAALLLEADPTLTGVRIRQLLTETAIPQYRDQGDTPELRNRWGAGRINAQDAMLRLLGRPSSIGSTEADSEHRLLLSQTPEALTVSLAGEQRLTVRLVSTAGAVAATRSGADTIDLPTSSLAPGIYIVEATGASGSRATRRIVIR